MPSMLKTVVVNQVALGCAKRLPKMVMQRINATCASSDPPAGAKHSVTSEEHRNSRLSLLS